MSSADSHKDFHTWSNQALQRMAKRDFTEADRMFGEILGTLGKETTTERALTLARVGSCRACMDRPGEAAEYFRAALRIHEKLEVPALRQQEALLLAELGNALRCTGDFDGARESYGKSLELFTELKDLQNAASVSGRQGSVAFYQREFGLAETCYRRALDCARDLKEPALEALASHQLGMVFQATGTWAEAETCYGDAARIRESLNRVTGPDGAAVSWTLLAQVKAVSGKIGEAEELLRRVLDAQNDSDGEGAAQSLRSLAMLLRTQPGRLGEARQFAERAAALQHEREDGTGEIWVTYDLLGDMAEEGGQADEAAQYRTLARTARRASPSLDAELRRYVPLIAAVVARVHGYEEAAAVVSSEQHAMRAAGDDWGRLADAIDAVLSGQRNVELLHRLDALSGIILETILQGIADPDSLESLVGP